MLVVVISMASQVKWYHLTIFVHSHEPHYALCGKFPGIDFLTKKATGQQPAKKTATSKFGPSMFLGKQVK